MYTKLSEEGILIVGSTKDIDSGINETARAAAAISKFIVGNEDFKGVLLENDVKEVMNNPVLLATAAAAAIHTAYHEEAHETSTEGVAFKSAFRVGRMLKYGKREESRYLARTVMDTISRREGQATEDALERLSAKYC